MKSLHQRLTLQALFFISPLVNLISSSRYTEGLDAYTFVPPEPVTAQSLTIYRSSGDIVVNRQQKIHVVVAKLTKR
jgi:hypothetical protein